MRDDDRGIPIGSHEYEAFRESLVQAQIARIEREERALGIIRIPRGRRRPVVRSDRTEYASVSAAAKANDVHKVDNVCQAIRRGGKCGGWRWAYKGEEPEGFYETPTRVRMRLFLQGDQFSFLDPEKLIPVPRHRLTLPRRHRHRLAFVPLPWPEPSPKAVALRVTFSASIPISTLPARAVA